MNLEQALDELLKVNKMDWSQPEHDEKRSDFESKHTKRLKQKEKEIKNNAVKNSDKQHKDLELKQLDSKRLVKLDKTRKKNKKSIIKQQYNAKFTPTLPSA